MTTAELSSGTAPRLSVLLRPRGAFWPAWRQSRPLRRVAGGLLLVAVLGLVTVHLLMADAEYGLTHGVCTDPGAWIQPQCSDLNDRIFRLNTVFLNVVQPAMVALPVVVGMFVGAPLLAQEYERGTIRLIRSQSVSPVRWLAARLVVPAAVVALSAGVVSVLTAWIWRADIAGHRILAYSPYPGFTYHTLGLAPLAWSLFGLALGAAVGVLLRRTVAAILVSGVLVVLAEVLMRQVRQYFVPLVHSTDPNSRNYLGHFIQPQQSWVVNDGVVLADGTRLPSSACGADYQVCENAPSVWGDYHPVSHFVPMQLVEAGLLLVLSAVLVALVFRRVTRTAL
ncbi:ABC transporter permease subunit [Kitasatospora sp. NPDC092948]|uniref:ABC transporter permease subunit n=1 Tax=Kitasatospora sp. NPDC092948 TaxID=3364088 RepID=UPI00382AF7E9